MYNRQFTILVTDLSNIEFRILNSHFYYRFVLIFIDVISFPFILILVSILTYNLAITTSFLLATGEEFHLTTANRKSEIQNMKNEA